MRYEVWGMRYEVWGMRCEKDKRLYSREGADR